MDPDVLVRKEGADSLKRKIKSAKDLFDYKLEILSFRHNIKDAHGKSRIAAEMLSTINKIDNAILRGEYTKRLSEKIALPEHYILEELNKLRPAATGGRVQEPAVKKTAFGINPAEKLLIKFMLEEKELVEKIMQELSPGDFTDARTVKIVSLMHDLCVQGKNVEPNILMNYFGEDEASQLVCESMFMPELLGLEREKAVNDCIRRIKVQRMRSRREQLHMQIKNAQSEGDEKKLGLLVKEFHDLLKKGA